MQPVKETAANIGASAKSGMEKTKATVQGKMERMSAHNPTEKEMATQRKQDRVHDAEMHKQEARQHNAAAKQATGGSHTYATTGQTGLPMGAHQMSAVPNARVTEGTVQSQPIGTATATKGGSTTGGGTAHGTGGGGGYAG